MLNYQRERVYIYICVKYTGVAVKIVSLGHATQDKSFNSYDFPAKKTCLTKESEWTG